jgi:hypothetical protein
MENLDESWRKSSYSGDGGGSCVEVGQAHGTVLVRDTKQHGRGLVHRFTSTAWHAFISDLKTGKAA